MGKSLGVARQDFQRNLYNAIYNAYMSQFDDTIKDAGIYAEKMHESMDRAAIVFADSLSKDLAEYIHKFILEMQISITHTIIPNTITTPMGPAAGAITVSPTEVTIS